MALALQGRNALVTGAARGIGRETARVLAGEGARVALLDIDPEVRDVAEALRASGHAAAWARADVGRREEVRRGVEQLRGELGEFDILVSNAGIVDHIAPVVSMRAEGWERELAVNLSGAFHLLQALLPGMVERGWGRIVLVSSVAARGGLHRQAGYAASKAGLVGLAQTVALEHARQGVTCNAVLPGLIATENVLRMPKEILDAAIARTPARRLGRTEEVAQAIAFLVSEAAGFINGAALPIDGGLSLNTLALGSRREARGA